MTLPLDPEALLDQRDFMRALARSLLADEHRAEDVVQEACLLALARPPRSEHALRPWLARVVRNLTSNARRGETRRADRELGSAAEQSVPTPDEIVERVTVERSVGEALLAVGEAYRTVLYMRFFEDLPPRAIAARLGVPVETVRSRLRRGLAAMRERLDREHGGERRAWSTLLLPLARGRADAAPRTFGAAAPTARLVSPAALVAAGVLVVGGGYALVGRSTRAPVAPAAIAAVPLARQIAANAPAGLRVPHAEPEARHAAGVLDPETRAPEATAAPLAGRVVDAFTGEPVGGLTLELTAADGARTTAVSAPDGRFATSAAFTRGRLLVEYSDGADRVQGRVAQLLHEGAREPALPVPSVLPVLPVLIGPTFTLAAELPDGLAWSDFVCTLLEGGDLVQARPRIEPVTGRPWVRFARRPALSSLSGGTRSRMTLRLASDDGRFAAEVELAARPGVHGTPVRFELLPGPPAAEPAREPGGSVAGTLASLTGAHRPAGSVVLRSCTDRERTFTVLSLTDEDGGSTFHFDDVPFGEYELVPPMDDGLPWEPPTLRIAVPARGLVLTCRDDVAARGLVVEAYDRESGAPLAEFGVSVLVDRYRLGKEGALALGPEPRTRPLAFGACATRIPEGAPVLWLVECPGYLSAQGDERDLRRTPDGWLLRVRLAPAWRADLTIGHLDSATFKPLAGARLVTVGGSLLGTSDEHGRLYLELSYDPGRLRLELDGWRVQRWEGFRNGRLIDPAGPHGVLMVRE